MNLTLYWQLRKRNKTLRKKNLYFEPERKKTNFPLWYFRSIILSFLTIWNFSFGFFPSFSPTNFLLLGKVLFYSQFSQTFIVCVVFYWRYLLLINRSSFSLLRVSCHLIVVDCLFKFKLNVKAKKKTKVASHFHYFYLKLPSSSITYNGQISGTGKSYLSTICNLSRYATKFQLW